MGLEYCCECDQATGNAGIMDDSLFAGHLGPYCEDCWGDLPAKLAEENDSLLAKIARLEAGIRAVREDLGDNSIHIDDRIYECRDTLAYLIGSK
jgi:hypothetical protein